MDTHDFLHNAIVYLGASVVAVPLSQRLGLGSVVGYLIAGVVIGPSALGLIGSAEQAMHFAEFGVVLLLFLIGLELNPRRLWQMRRPIFGMGGAQVLLCVGLLGLAWMGLGQTTGVAFTAAMGFSMSSTALVLQLLRERGLLQIPAGQSSFAVLLFQDLAVIPMLALLPLLAPVSGTGQAATTAAERWIPVGKGALAIVGIVLLGRYLIRPLFRVVASTNLREIFTAFSLALILGVAALMQAVGLSMALGAFLAGVLLADSEFRHELEIDLEPFKGLLLGLFFVAVGMSMDVRLFLASPLVVLMWVAAMLAGKIAILYGVGRLFGHSREESLVFSIGMSQGGEFAFVLFGVAGRLGILTTDQAGLLNIAVAVSMATTPFLFIGYEKLLVPWLKCDSRGEAKKYEVQSEGNPVILAGFGRIGQVVGRFLHAQKVGVTILETDPGQIEVVRRFGWKTFYGDVSRLDLLRAAGAAEAKLLILAIDDMDAAMRTVHLAKENFPHLRVLVRAEDRLNAYRFIDAGVSTVRATFAPGLEMGEEALKLLGYPAYETRVIGQRFQRYDRVQLFRAAAHINDTQTLISMVKESRDELARIMETDDRRRGEMGGGGGWG
jgi:monovalent cation:proton antiporter-2 (CPA2) family protein